MDRIVPFGFDAKAGRSLLAFFAESIMLAHRSAPSKWGVTPFDPGVRLNVGFCEAITLFPDQVSILALRPRLPQRGLRGVRIAPGYSSSPGSALLEFEPAEVPMLRHLLNTVREAHEASIVVSARRGFNAGAREGHSDGAVQQLAGFLRQELPLPTFKRQADTTEHWEGAVVAAAATRYERNRAARTACLAHYGFHCAACGLLFEQRYGPDAEGLIHVHHVIPVAAKGARYRVDPVRDLRPVCPNCHAVIHAARPPRSVEEVRRMIRRPT